MYGNVNVRRPGERNRRVKIDNNAIDLYQAEVDVKEQIAKAMEVTIREADYHMTERMIDEVKVRNETEKTKEGIFTSTLEKFINNVGRKIPHDSHSHFFKDHYDIEVKKRGGIVGDNVSTG